jgi:hypothetical protein
MVVKEVVKRIAEMSESNGLNQDQKQTVARRSGNFLRARNPT